MQMPELTGLDLQRALTESGREEQVIFITGNGDIPICARAMKAGAADFLPEPLAAVQRALVRSGAQQLEKDEQTDARPRIATLTPPGDRWEDEQRNCRGPRDSAQDGEGAARASDGKNGSGFGRRAGATGGEGGSRAAERILRMTPSRNCRSSDVCSARKLLSALS
jgi:response regulator receiver domain-containing protein